MEEATGEANELISTEVIEKAKIAFEHQENWVAYNNTLLFVHESDIQFFGSRDEAEDYADAINDEGNFVQIIRFGSCKEMIDTVEKEFQTIINNKKQFMDLENLEYLGKQQLYLGFGEALHAQLEEKLKEGLPEFQLNASHTFGKDQMEAVLSYKRSEKEDSERYFCNSYVATLKKEEGDISQFIYVNNKGNSITFKEACNLLNGRSVFKELQPKTGEAYFAWVKIDHEKIDEKTGYPKLRPFGEGYGFDLHEAVGRMPFKELGDSDKLQTLYASLEKGNAAPATLLKEGKELKVSVAAEPEFHTLKMWDANGVKMFVPNKKVEEKYGQAPADEVRQQNLLGNGEVRMAAQAESTLNGAQVEGVKQDGVQGDSVKQEKRVDLMPKKINNHLLEKKRTRKQGQGQSMS